ncbi:MAG: hypothetical protein WCZ89_00935 [Phycisphaerae bacterium]
MFKYYYTNIVSQATRSWARGTLMFGLFLIGLGVLILLLPAIFVFIAAFLFFITGAGAVGTALKMFFAQRKIDKLNQDDTEAYRKNVRIHIEDNSDEF